MLRRRFVRLLAVRSLAAGVLAGPGAAVSAAAPAAVPTEETGFGSNPGGLQMFRYAPAGLAAGAPVVVALHGCAQTASQYGDESGWLQLADRWRFALLLPQKPYYGCFTWYDSADTSRGQGEALSIEQMVVRM